MKRVLYHVPGMEAVVVRRDLEYWTSDEGALTMDVYYPPDVSSGTRAPAVIFVFGYSDTGFQRMLGCKQKEMESFTSWARLTAASGLVAVTYTTAEPATDLQALVQYIRLNAASLGIEEDRLGLWACSGHVPNALSILMNEASDFVRCAVFCYGYMLDLEGGSAVAEAASLWGFANPCAGSSIEALAQDRPIFIVRAGQDQMPGLNEALDLFVSKALARNLPVTLVNLPAAPHAFDLLRDEDDTRETVGQMLGFMRFHLLR